MSDIRRLRYPEAAVTVPSGTTKSSIYYSDGYVWSWSVPGDRRNNLFGTSTTGTADIYFIYEGIVYRMTISLSGKTSIKAVAYYNN